MHFITILMHFIYCISLLYIALIIKFIKYICIQHLLLYNYIVVNKIILYCIQNTMALINDSVKLTNREEWLVVVVSETIIHVEANGIKGLQTERPRCR